MDKYCGILDKLFYILINIGLVAFLNFYYNRKLQKQTARFSLYNQIQIESLKKTYKLLTSFKFITIQINDNDNKDFEFYKTISDKWLMSYFDLTNTLSHEKYIFPKSIKKSYSNTIEDLNILRNYIINNTKLKESFETHFNGMEFIENLKPHLEQDYIAELIDKTQKINKEDLFNSVTEKIEILRNKIELKFEKMN